MSITELQAALAQEEPAMVAEAWLLPSFPTGRIYQSDGDGRSEWDFDDLNTFFDAFW